MNRNRAVTSTAITKAVSSATAGDLQIATETLLTAIAIIKQSRVYEDECCQALVTSLKDCLVSIQGNYVDRYVHLTLPIPTEKLKLRVELTSAMTACCLRVTHLTRFPTGAAVGHGTKKGVMTEVATESKNETGIGTEKILMVGKVQEHHEDTENAPGVETGTRTGQGHRTGNGTETDTANVCLGMLKVSFIGMFSSKYEPLVTISGVISATASI